MLYNMHVDQIMPKLLQAFWNGSTGYKTCFIFMKCGIYLMG